MKKEKHEAVNASEDPSLEVSHSIAIEDVEDPSSSQHKVSVAAHPGLHRIDSLEESKC